MDNGKPDWDNIYPKLLARAHYLITRRHWFRGTSIDSTVAGQQAEDYAQEAILRYLQDPDKINAHPGLSVESYLKYYVIRTLVGNDVRSFENRQFSVLPEFGSFDETGGDTVQAAQLLAINYYFDEGIDYETVMAKLEEMVMGDDIAEKILLGSQCNMERRDIIREFDMDGPQYDNGVRRLNTKKIAVANHFNLKEKSS